MNPEVSSSAVAAPPKSPWLTAAIVAGALGFIAAPLYIARAPVEQVMGVVQKIFYFHVPCAWLLFLSTFVCAGGSVAFLFRGSARGDRVALVCAELGVLFGLCVMVSGPLWGRVAWGVYWQWDARLTSALLLWLMLIAYLLARRYGGPAAKKVSAALALFAAADVPLVYVSVNVWRTIHPQTEVVRSLKPGMAGPFWFSMLVLTILWVVMFVVRLRLEDARAALDDLEMAYEDMVEERS